MSITDFFFLFLFFYIGAISIYLLVSILAFYFVLLKKVAKIPFVSNFTQDGKSILYWNVLKLIYTWFPALGNKEPARLISFKKSPKWPLIAILRLILTFLWATCFGAKYQLLRSASSIFCFYSFYWLQKYLYFILNISEIKNQSEFYTRLSLWSLPCEQSFLSCMPFNCVYEVVRVTCQSRSWFVLYFPLKISHITLFGRKDDNIPQI